MKKNRKTIERVQRHISHCFWEIRFRYLFDCFPIDYEVDVIFEVLNVLYSVEKVQEYWELIKSEENS